MVGGGGGGGEERDQDDIYGAPGKPLTPINSEIKFQVHRTSYENCPCVFRRAVV